MTGIPPFPIAPQYPKHSICDLGVSFSEIQYWMPERPFNNVLRQLGVWEEIYISPDGYYTGSSPNYNISGIPIDVKTGTYLRAGFYIAQPTPLFGDTYYPSGTYVFSYDGSGRIYAGGDASLTTQDLPAGPSSFNLTVTNPTAGGIEIRLYASNLFRFTSIYKVGDASSLTSDVLNPEFKSLWSRARATRFMDWTFTNNSRKVDTSSIWSIKLDTSAYSVVSSLVGAAMSGISSGARGSVRKLDFGSIITDFNPEYQGALSAINGVWVHYTPINTTKFIPGETVDFGTTSIRMRKSTYYPNAAETDVPASGIAPGDIESWYFSYDYTFAGEASGVYSNQPYTGRIGVPIKTIVDTCNSLQTDLWYNISYLMSDAYISAVALYVRDNLSTHLRANFEFDNEPWNVQFHQTRHHIYEGSFVSGFNTGSIYTDGKKRVIVESNRALTKVRDIFNLTSRPVETWINMQAAGALDNYYTLLEIPNALSVVSAHGFAIAPYMGAHDEERAGYFSPANLALTSVTADTIANYMLVSALQRSIEDVSGYVTLFTVPSGIKIGFYECGQHLDSTMYNQNPTIDLKLSGANLHPVMGQAYFYYFALMKQWTGYNSIPMHYASMSNFIAGNYWGLLRRYNDLSPKYHSGWLNAIRQCDVPGMASNSSNSGAVQWRRQKCNSTNPKKR